ncbi:hypothetical protein K9U40_09460 [Xanthobacter autotrophicus]|uniref:hypothetical protein n=1 Tax=Xanthobacter TaxID=279 RepID=UPI0024AACFEB|nr:hypothetical protein [Xanthobacter autotrophicus]MDI4664550.1 hypothetical protein [Xanthobacter autotrophicus]
MPPETFEDYRPSRRQILEAEAVTCIAHDLGIGHNHHDCESVLAAKNSALLRRCHNDPRVSGSTSAERSSGGVDFSRDQTEAEVSKILTACEPTWLLPAHFQSTFAARFPMQDIHYREYKILLRPQQFYAPKRFEDYWGEIKNVAKKHGVGVTTNENAFKRMVREVLFYDTPDYDLYRNSFILRKRTFYDDGWPRPEHELAVKFRSPDRERCIGMDMAPRMVGEVEVKFKEEILPLKDALGGMRSLYSHNCIVISPGVVLNQGLRDIAAVFPAMSCVDVDGDTRIDLVNNIAVEEIQVDPGHFDFGHGYEAKATIAIWRNRASETSLVGEFAFQAKFQHYDEIHQKAKRLSEEFFRDLQTLAPEWVQLGTTKTAMVYGIGARQVAHSE